VKKLKKKTELQKIIALKFFEYLNNNNKIQLVLDLISMDGEKVNSSDKGMDDCEALINSKISGNDFFSDNT